MRMLSRDDFQVECVAGNLESVGIGQLIAYRIALNLTGNPAHFLSDAVNLPTLCWRKLTGK